METAAKENFFYNARIMGYPIKLTDSRLQTDKRKGTSHDANLTARTGLPQVVARTYMILKGD